MRRFGYILFRLFLSVILFGLIFIILLYFAGKHLVHQSTWQHAKYALVLEGQTQECERTQEGLRLLKEGRIDTLILSSMRAYRNRYTYEFIYPDLVAQGGDSSRILVFPHGAQSTIEETRLIAPALAARGIDTLLVITANYHTARAFWIMEKIFNNHPVILMHPAADPYYNTKCWLSSRLSFKTGIIELLKHLGARIENIIYQWKGLPALPTPPDRSILMGYPANMRHEKKPATYIPKPEDFLFTPTLSELPKPKSPAY